MERLPACPKSSTVDWHLSLCPLGFSCLSEPRGATGRPTLFSQFVLSTNHQSPFIRVHPRPILLPRNRELHPPPGHLRKPRWIGRPFANLLSPQRVIQPRLSH
jgi:hypothetical protein